MTLQDWFSHAPAHIQSHGESLAQAPGRKALPVGNHARCVPSRLVSVVSGDARFDPQDSSEPLCSPVAGIICVASCCHQKDERILLEQENSVGPSSVLAASSPSDAVRQFRGREHRVAVLHLLLNA